jgi:hypothetical protein
VRLLIATVLVGAGLLVGCGSSSSTSSSGTSAPPSAAPSTSSSTPSTSAGGSSPTPSSATLAQGIARCKASVAAAPTLSAESKNKLEGLCDQLASGNTAQVRKTAASVCQQIIKASLPASEQQAAQAECPKP